MDKSSVSFWIACEMDVFNVVKSKGSLGLISVVLLVVFGLDLITMVVPLLEDFFFCRAWTELENGAGWGEGEEEQAPKRQGRRTMVMRDDCRRQDMYLYRKTLLSNLAVIHLPGAW